MNATKYSNFNLSDSICPLQNYIIIFHRTIATPALLQVFLKKDLSKESHFSTEAQLVSNLFIT